MSSGHTYYAVNDIDRATVCHRIPLIEFCLHQGEDRGPDTHMPDCKVYELRNAKVESSQLQ